MSSPEDKTPDAGSENGAATPDPEAEAKAKAAAEAKAKAAAEAKAKREAEEAAKPLWERDPATPEWIDAADDPIAEMLRKNHGEAIRAARSYAGDLVLDIERDQIKEVCESLKTEGKYTLFVDLCGAHYPDREEAPFDVVYIAYSFEENRRVRLRVQTDEDTPVPTVSTVWKGANWPEREVYDMYGVRFADHPDMTRILLWEGFNGHPLRKEFPIEGIDTGAAIYPERYESEAGPVAGAGTGWQPPKPKEEEEEGTAPKAS